MEPSRNPLIRLRNVEKRVPSGGGFQYLLRRVNVDIERGEFVTVMGPSGAGKTTLLSVLGLLDAGWSGEYHLDREAVHALPPKRRQALGRERIGIVFQQYHLLDDLTVAENLDVPLSYRNVKASERAALVAETLDRFGIVARKDLYPSQLSGGQQQLVGIARALIGRPSLLLADEPTGNLHSSQAREIMELFRKVNGEGTTIVQVSHSAENAAYGNRVIELKDGWVVSGGVPDPAAV
jgi:ABC-type lipoprotein export system ATPase subunit